ncbi:Acetyltransferase (GNAT) domain-containing protein [Draconibacterium orientale]|uniref:Acetyltransferase (GNAT) domain-containing protein n=1 Tax=Draconibacterium orientale TaxID=1168034 RepID=X5DWJ4_9BACT|nr:GNAT family N-acetyltransferase [Draconibacterium orientale]AHW59580.1 GCN5 family acetyltransferase [Draconibacterium orientale]SES84215.1 Acetyltransferase (GNAT) domain-containing protein [Draconibacterium orientale]
MNKINPTQLLNRQHNRTNFHCDEKLLDVYLKRQAGQDVRKRLSACFVLTAYESNEVIGYYTLSNNSIPLQLVPEVYRKKFPSSYESIPTTLLGRLAIDKNYQGKGLGEFLLVDALKRSYEISQTSASFAVVTDPINNKAAEFYEKYGFQKLPDSGKMFIPMKTLSDLFKST